MVLRNMCVSSDEETDNKKTPGAGAALRNAALCYSFLDDQCLEGKKTVSGLADAFCLA